MPKSYTCAGAMAPADDRNEPDADASENAKAGEVAWEAIKYGEALRWMANGGPSPDEITDGQVVNALLAADGVKRRGKRVRR